jgi:hypothetical protein
MSPRLVIDEKEYAHHSTSCHIHPASAPKTISMRESDIESATII